MSDARDRCELLCLDLAKAEAVRARLAGLGAAEPARLAHARSDPTRVRLAAALATGDELCVCDLAWIVERSDRLVSHHVRALRDAGIAESRRAGKVVFYRLTERGRLVLGTLVPDALWLSVTSARSAVFGESHAPRQTRAAARVDGNLVARRGACDRARRGHRRRLGRARRVRDRQPDRARSRRCDLWLLTAGRVDSETAERRAQQMIAGTYALLAAYVAIDATRGLIEGVHPGTSWIGIALAATTAPTMPLLAIAKRRTGRALGSRATESEGTQNMLCAYLSLALLVGLGANALLGWWWADPAAALVIGAVAVREARASWAGEARSCCAPDMSCHRSPG